MVAAGPHGRGSNDPPAAVLVLRRVTHHIKGTVLPQPGRTREAGEGAARRSRVDSTVTPIEKNTWPSAARPTHPTRPRSMRVTRRHRLVRGVFPTELHGPQWEGATKCWRASCDGQHTPPPRACCPSECPPRAAASPCGCAGGSAAGLAATGGAAIGPRRPARRPDHRRAPQKAVRLWAGTGAGPAGLAATASRAPPPRCVTTRAVPVVWSSRRLRTTADAPGGRRY